MAAFYRPCFHCGRPHKVWSSPSRIPRPFCTIQCYHAAFKAFTESYRDRLRQSQSASEASSEAGRTQGFLTRRAASSRLSARRISCIQ